jgi:multicomponent K+:H+ antiporter subunit G
MNAWVEGIVALLLVSSGLLAVLGAIGIVGLRDFYTRLHAPALANTVGAWCASAASIVHLSIAGPGLSLQPLVLNILLAVTAPITTVLLARAGLFRDREARRDVPPPLMTRE